MPTSFTLRTFFRRPMAMLLVLAVSAAPPAARADETDDLVKKANQTLRQAERLLHDGKTAEVDKELNSAEKLLARIEAAQPDHVKLKILRSKCTKLRKDLERRRAKTDGPSGGKKPDQTKPADLPRAARQAMERFEDAKRIIEHAYRWIEKSKTTELSKPVAKYFEEVETRIQELEIALREAKKRAADEGVRSHATLDEAQAYLDAAPGRLATVRAEMEQFNKDNAQKTAAQEAVRSGPDPSQAAKDWKDLATLCKEYQDNFQSQSALKARGAKALAAWQDWKKRFEPVRKRFRDRYGDRNPDIYAAFENVPQPEGVTMPATQAAGMAFDIDLAQCERNFAGWAAGWGKDALRISRSIKKDNKEKLELKYVRAEDAVRHFKLAKLWHPDTDYGRQIAESEAAAKEALPLWKEVLKELEWPGHDQRFAGPGKPDDLAKAALDFLRENPNWSAPEYDDEHVPLAACVEADAWSISKRAPLTQEPTQYSLAILVAFRGQADPDLVYVYHMVFYTTEAAGVKPGLPFRYANSKQHARFRMLKENVPAE